MLKRLGERLFKFYCHPDFQEDIKGDLEEYYAVNLEEKGEGYASKKYFIDSLLLFRLSLLKRNWTSHNSNYKTMIFSIIKTALRVFWKERVYTSLNILGLTVGICSSLMLYLYVKDELSINKFHKNADRIYQVMEHQYYSGDQVFTIPVTPGPLEDAFKDEMPEVDHVAQVTRSEERLFRLGDKTIKSAGRMASEDFFHLFTFPFSEGSKEGSLIAPDVVYISQNLANKLSNNGADIILGKTVMIRNWGDYKIGGVFVDVPDNSTLQFEFVLPLAPWKDKNPWSKDWESNGMRNFLGLKKGVDQQAFSAKIKDYLKTKSEESTAHLFIQNIGDRYLYNKFRDGKQVGGRIAYVKLFSAVAIFILLIACINFMNLTTARSSKRAKEISVKKVMGATRRLLAAQFMTESVLMAVISGVLAGFLVMLFLPGLNEFTGKEMAFSIFDPRQVLLLASLALMLGLLAGSYPSLSLSSFSALKILKSGLQISGRHNRIRKGLIVCQFFISTFLIIGTLIVHKQIGFVKTANLGFNKENLIYFPIDGDLENKERLATFKSSILNIPTVSNVATANEVPIYYPASDTDFTWEGKDPDNKTLYQVLRVGYDFIETFQLKIADGRPFNQRFPTDTANLIINRQAADLMSVDPVEYPVSFWDRKGKVVGIVENFHFTSLHNKIGPLVISLRPENARYIFLRVESDKLENTLMEVEEVFKELNPNYPFEYDFLGDSYAALYNRETDTGTLANYFAGIAIFIALLGLFGLASYAAQQKIKELAIRKVLGAGVPTLIMLLTKNFLLLVLIGFAVAAPLAHYVMSNWLGTFEYKVSIGAVVFLVAGGGSILIALVTVSYHAIRAAFANPVKNLRYE